MRPPRVALTWDSDGFVVKMAGDSEIAVADARELVDRLLVWTKAMRDTAGVDREVSFTRFALTAQAVDQVQWALDAWGERAPLKLLQRAADAATTATAAVLGQPMAGGIFFDESALLLIADFLAEWSADNEPIPFVCH